MWNDVTCSLYFYSITKSYIFSSYFILIMKCCVRNNYSPNIYWLYSCHWSQGTSSSNLDIYVFNLRICTVR